MRVLHVSSGKLYGGVETLLGTLASCRDLCAEMQPEFALCFDGRIADELRQSGARVHILGAVRVRNPVQVISARRRLLEILNSSKFDAVICHMAWPLAIFRPVVRRANLPLIFWMHDAALQRDWLSLWAGLSRPELVICNSQFTASTTGRLLGRTPVEILYNPVVCLAKKLQTAQREALRTRLDIAHEALVLIQVSRMQPGKGHWLLLDALARLAHAPQWVCWIAGGPQRPEEVGYAKSLHARAIDLGIEHRIRFLGQRSDVAELLLAADIYCQPNLGPEAFGIAIIEAMHAGLPVVTTEVGGPVEILDESCGVLVPPNDAVSLATQLETLMRNEGLRRRLGAAAIRRAARLCDPATQLNRLHTLILRTLAPAHVIVAADACL